MTHETNRTGGGTLPPLRVLLPPTWTHSENGAQRLHPATTKPRRRLPPEVLTDIEDCKLLRACGRYTPTGVRNRALIALLYRTGLRINEALCVYPKDLDLADGSVRVLYGKGGRSLGKLGHARTRLARSSVR